MRKTKLKARVFDLAVFLIATGLLGYFVWQAENGPRSISYQTAILHQQKQKTTELEDWRIKRKNLASRVDMMRSQAIEPDLLDELVRAELGLASENEVIIHR